MLEDVLRDRLVAVLAADAAGYSRLMSLDDRSTLAALDVARGVFRDEIARHGGRVVDMAGDSVMSVFESAAGAMQAALAVQRQLHLANGDVPGERQLRFRIGLHVGDVLEKPDGTIYGDGVNIAARLEGLAEPGAMAISQAVHGMVARRVDAVFEDIGEQAVKNIAQPVRVFRVRLPGRAESVPGAANAATPPPVASASPRDVLFGREELLERLCRQMGNAGTRLLTLTGPGGSGKTRLALRAAEQLAPTMADGVRVVLLAPVRDTLDMMSAVASALGLQEAGATSLSILVQGYLRQRQVLLALDNLEHLPEAGAEVSALLEACPRLKVLATSRVLLHIGGEHELKVPPLALPAAEGGADVAASPAVALFAARAAALGRDVLSSAEERRAAAQICRRLEGLPLAIELAAARLRALTPVALADRLQHSLPMLKGGAADAPKRQQTLRHTIAWSHDLLDAPVRLLFRRLGVFAGGWSLEAADALLDDGDALDALEKLIDHNLARRVDDVDGQPRFAMLETIREYALEQLAAAGEADLARARHAAFCTALAALGAPHLTSAGRLPWLLRLRADMNNFRLALHWLVRERRDADGALGLAASLTWLWYFDGLYREGLGWMTESMQLPGAQAPTAAAAAVLSGMARLASFSGDMAYAHQQAAQSIERWRALGERRGLGFALFHQAIPALVIEGRDAAVAVLREARQCFDDVNDAWGVALATVYEGVARALHPGDEAQAQQVLNEGLARSQALGDEWAASTCSSYIGSVAQRRGDYATARRGYAHILSVARQTGDRFRMARSTHLLGELDLIEGRHAEALGLMAEALALAQEQGRSADVPQLLRAIARALVGREQHAPAATLFGAASRSEGQHSTLPPEDTASAAAATVACRSALGAALFDSHWQAGSVWPTERAIQQAQAWALDFRPLVA